MKKFFVVLLIIFFGGCTGLRQAEQAKAPFASYSLETPADADKFLFSDTDDSDTHHTALANDLPIGTATQSALDEKQETPTNEAGLYSALSDVSNFTQPSIAETITENWVNTTYPWADDEVADNITIDLASVATTANAGDSATSFFPSGTIEDERIASTIARDSELHAEVTLGTANGLSLSTQALSLAAATNSSPGAATAAQITALEAALTVSGTPAAHNIVGRNAANDDLEYKSSLAVEYGGFDNLNSAVYIDGPSI